MTFTNHASGASCGVHMLNENLTRLALRKLQPARAYLQGRLHTSLEQLVEENVINPFERFHKPTKDWDILNNAAVRVPMRFTFRGLRRSDHQSCGCESDNEFTITG